MLSSGNRRTHPVGGNRKECGHHESYHWRQEAGDEEPAADCAEEIIERQAPGERRTDADP